MSDTMLALLMAVSGTVAAANGELADVVRRMLEGPPGDLTFEVRISESGNGPDRIATRLLVKRIAGDGKDGWRLEVSDFDGGSLGRWRCSEQGVLVAAERGSANAPAHVPGTTIPWSVVTGSPCAAFDVLPVSGPNVAGDAETAAFDVLSAAGSGGIRSRVYLSTRTRLPVRIERYREDESPFAVIRVLRARRTPWGPAIRVFRYIDLDTDTTYSVETRPRSNVRRQGTPDLFMDAHPGSKMSRLFALYLRNSRPLRASRASIPSILNSNLQPWGPALRVYRRTEPGSYTARTVAVPLRSNVNRSPGIRGRARRLIATRRAARRYRANRGRIAVCTMRGSRAAGVGSSPVATR